jgi:ferredoxin/flavodoxin---NADP+ reductase
VSASTGAAPLVQGLVAVVGAGPAGLYGAQILAGRGAHVALLNRDVKPGGLAEYGIFPTKHKMKEGIRRQFRSILDSDRISYFGHVTVGDKGTLTLDELRQFCDAVLVTVGAQGTKWLGLPGEDLRGVHHAKDLVYHYNELPPFATRSYDIGRRVAVVGVGNVALDITRWLVRMRHVDEVVLVARRGPGEVKFDRSEMESVARNLDLAALDAEIARVRPVMEAAGQDPGAARDFILSALPKALEAVSAARVRPEFLASPARIVGEGGRVTGLEVDETTLVQGPGGVETRDTGRKRVIACDTVVFAVGDSVDASLGLKVHRAGFAVHPAPRFPIDGASYEAVDARTGALLPDVFLAGWARVPSQGLVGMARKDGNAGANAVLQWLTASPGKHAAGEAALRARLERSGAPLVDKRRWRVLEEVEKAEAQKRGVEEFKFSSDDDMLQAMGWTPGGAR